MTTETFRLNDTFSLGQHLPTNPFNRMVVRMLHAVSAVPGSELFDEFLTEQQALIDAGHLKSIFSDEELMELGDLFKSMEAQMQNGVVPMNDACLVVDQFDRKGLVNIKP